MEPLLSIKHLTLERGERCLQQRENFDFFTGEILRLAGPNGAGKTSLMRVIAGFITPQAGQFIWKGTECPVRQFQSHILYIGHRPSIRSAFTLTENMHWWAQLMGVKIEHSDIQAVIEPLQLLGYEDEACIHLSAGQKRRVALARLGLCLRIPSLKASKPLWILDEPFTALDPNGVDVISDWMSRHVHQNGAVIYSTHQTIDFGNVHRERLLTSSQQWIAE